MRCYKIFNNGAWSIRHSDGHLSDEWDWVEGPWDDGTATVWDGKKNGERFIVVNGIEFPIKDRVTYHRGIFNGKPCYDQLLQEDDGAWNIHRFFGDRDLGQTSRIIPLIEEVRGVVGIKRVDPFGIVILEIPSVQFTSMPRVQIDDWYVTKDGRVFYVARENGRYFVCDDETSDCGPSFRNIVLWKRGGLLYQGLNDAGQFVVVVEKEATTFSVNAVLLTSDCFPEGAVFFAQIGNAIQCLQWTPDKSAE